MRMTACDECEKVVEPGEAYWDVSLYPAHSGDTLIQRDLCESCVEVHVRVAFMDLNKWSLMQVNRIQTYVPKST